jgi:hypothetical protein
MHLQDPTRIKWITTQMMCAYSSCHNSLYYETRIGIIPYLETTHIMSSHSYHDQQHDNYASAR